MGEATFVPLPTPAPPARLATVMKRETQATSDEQLFARVTERLVAAIRPEKIIAFGSRAKGDARPDSDLDLLVVEDRGGSLGERGVRVRRALGGLGVPLDLIVQTPTEFEQMRRWRSSISAIAEREGRVLYDRARAA